MNRADAVAFIADRVPDYLAAASREASDAAGKSLKPIIDDAFRALGFAAAEIPTATTSGEGADEDLRVQLTYRALLQITRDLGATFFRVSVSGDSFDLGKVRDSVEKDVAEAKAAVLERFGTLGVVAGDNVNPFVTIDMNFLTDCEVA